jgi:nucleoside-diphosphate-sugar epimerase
MKALVVGGAGFVGYRLIKKLLNEPIEVLEGEGFASVHVDELVEAFILVTMNEKAIGQVFNVVNPNTFVTYYEIAQHIVKKTDSKSRSELLSLLNLLT